MDTFRAHDAIVVVDLGFGDAGKGATVDWLCGELGDVAAVVRFNGGAQAAHNVQPRPGVHHTFSQFGSGTFAGVPTLLSQHMLVEPIALATEARELAVLGVADPLALLRVDGRALITTPIHVAANRARERARGNAQHGSCGKGIGETAWFALENPGVAPTVADCARPTEMAEKLAAMAGLYGELLADRPAPDIGPLTRMYADFAAAVRIVDGEALAGFAARGRMVFEGAQGVLLDEWRGLHPHTTWSTVEPRNARAMLAEIGVRPYVLGVTRSYMTRHGAGPFPTADEGLTGRLREAHNTDDGYQGRFLAGHLDPILLRYAIAACGTAEGVDGLAVSHLDRLDADVAQYATAYDTDAGVISDVALGQWQDLDHQQRLTDLLRNARPRLVPAPQRPDLFTGLVADQLGVPVVSVAAGPGRDDRRPA